MHEQFELGALRESTLPGYHLVIYFSEFLPAKESVRVPWTTTSHALAHHDQRLLHAKDGIA